jgi:hypothetical protein
MRRRKQKDISKLKMCTGITGNEQGFPVVTCLRSEDDIHLVFWCSFCERPHYHGACHPSLPGGGDGHRVAHCDNPEFSQGYILREV